MQHKNYSKRLNRRRTIVHYHTKELKKRTKSNDKKQRRPSETSLSSFEGKMPVKGKRGMVQEIIQAEALTVLNIIQGKESDPEEGKNNDQDNFMLQNEYLWKNDGGEEVLQEMYRELYDTSYNEHLESKEKLEAEK